jgi:hypothetical protein
MLERTIKFFVVCAWIHSFRSNAFSRFFWHKGAVENERKFVMQKYLAFAIAIALVASAADAKTRGTSLADKAAAGWTDPTTGNQGNGKGVGNAGGTKPVEVEVEDEDDTGSTDTGSTDTGSTDTGSTDTGSTDNGDE